MWKKSIVIGVINLMGGVLAALGDMESEVLAEAADENPPEIGRLDRYHTVVNDRMRRYVHGFDCFLAGQHVKDDPTGSWIRVIPRVEWEEGSGFSFGSAFKSRIILPHLNDRLELIADNIPSALLPGKDVAPGDYDKVKAGLRVNLLQRGLSLLDVDAGVNLNPWPAPFVRLTLSHAFIWDTWSLELSQQGFLYVNDDGFGEMSQIEMTKALSPDSYFRSTSAATWSEETMGVEWEQSFLFWRELSSRRTIDARVSFFGHVDSSSVMDNYRVNSTYRWNAFRPWLFFSITPQVSFPADRDFKMTPLLRFCMEITWGDF